MRSLSSAQSSKLLLALSSILLAVGVMALGAALLGRRHADHEGPRGEHPQQGQALGAGRMGSHRQQGEQQQQGPRGEHMPRPDGQQQGQQQQGPRGEHMPRPDGQQQGQQQQGPRGEHMPRPDGQQQGQQQQGPRGEHKLRHQGQHDQKPHRACRFTLALAVMAIIAGAVGQYAGWKASPCAAKAFVLLVVVLSVMHVMALHRGVGIALQHCEESTEHGPRQQTQQHSLEQAHAQRGPEAHDQKPQPNQDVAKPVDLPATTTEEEKRDAPRDRKAIEQLRKPEADEMDTRKQHGGAPHADECRRHVRRVSFAIGAVSQLLLIALILAAVAMIRAVRKAGMTPVPTTDDVVLATVVTKADPLADEEAPVSAV